MDKNNQHEKTIINNNNIQQKNSVGTAGFILALIGIFTGEIPVIGWIIWLLGAILSVMGLTRQPKGLAIAGTVISFFSLLLILILGAILAGSIGILGSL